jgi:STE24 endopeptidase
MGVQAWWMTWLAATLLSLGLGYLAPSLILPLFNRFEPLANGELRNAIEDYARKEQFPIQGTFVMDGSKRSTKRNAFFTGFGRLRRLVLFDTLLQNHTHSEILAIVAHEMGHFKLGHIPKSIAISILTQGALFWTIGRFLASPLAVAGVQETLGLQEITTAGSLLVIALLYSPISRVLSVGMLAFSRKNEFEADAYSRRTFGDAEALISALQKMEKDHLSHPSPHPLKVILEYSHPPVEKRAQALRCQTLGESQDFSVLK